MSVAPMFPAPVRLPAFGTLKMCPKCGCEKFSRRWLEDERRMKGSCAECCFIFYEAPRDAAVAP